MVQEVSWGDGSGGKIYLSCQATEGDQTVLVSSDANTGLESRTKEIAFSTSEGGTAITRSLSVTQESDFKRVQYLSCNGKSAIDTGIVVESTDEIGIDYQLHSLSQGGDKFMLSCKQGYSGGGIWFETYGNGNKWYVRFGSSSSVSVQNDTFITGRHTAILKKQSCKIDGTTLVTPNYSSMPNTTLNFGGRITSSGVTGFYGYIYECWIKDKDGLYKFHGFPYVRKSDSKAGFGDTVSGDFQESVLNAFVAGPDVQ